jgi:hypothetical protein
VRSRKSAAVIGQYVFWLGLIGATLIVFLLGGDPTSFRYIGF